MERLKATVMIMVGVGAAADALWDGHELVVLDQVIDMVFLERCRR